MPWISVEDAKAHLKKSPNPSADDGELQRFVNAACAVIEDLMGHVDLVTATETQRAEPVAQQIAAHYWYTPWRAEHIIVLRETPIAAVTSVTWVEGLANTDVLPSTDPSNPWIGWTLVDNVLHVPFWGEYTVAYQAGRAAVPENYSLAALELVAHLWRQSQLNQNSGRPAIGGDQMEIMPRVASALPYRVRELLGIYGEVVNSYVVIG